MSKIKFVGGEKGGIGKSLFCSVLLESFLNDEKPFYLFDMDRSNPDVGRAYAANIYQDSTAQKIYFSEDPNDIYLADQIYEKASVLDMDIIVNLPSQVEFLLNKWLLEQGIIEAAKETKVSMDYYFVTDGTNDSLNILREMLKLYDGEAWINYTIVVNEGLKKSRRSDVEKLFTEQQVNYLTLGYLNISPKTKGIIAANNLRYCDALESSQVEILERQRLKKFLRESIKQF
jgi:MinD superfamily P-loop ATPase